MRTIRDAAPLRTLVKRAAFAAALAALLMVLPARATAAAAPTPSVHDLMRDPGFTAVKLAPDGQHVAAARIDAGRKVIDIYTLPDVRWLSSYSVDGLTDVEDFYWAGNTRLVVGFAYRLGPLGSRELNGDLIAVNIDGTKPQVLLGHPGRISVGRRQKSRDFEVVDTQPDDAGHILISIDDAERGSAGFPSLYRMDIVSGEKTRLMRSWMRNSRFITDAYHRLRFIIGTREDGKTVLFERGAQDDRWKEIARNTLQADGVEVWGLSQDGRNIYLAEDTGRSTAGLYRLDLASNQESLIYRDPVYDITSWLPGLRGGEEAGVTVEADVPRWQLFDPADAESAQLQGLRKTFPGKAVVLNGFNADHTLAVAQVYSDIDPGSFYLIDLRKHQPIAHFPTRPWLDQAQFSQTRPIEYRARDGLTIHGYFTRGITATADKIAPLIVLPHGGPYGLRDVWGFDPEVQLLATHGYSVLQVNYRGSGGYGREFVQAGYRQWGAAMEDDLTDAVHWAVAHQLADAHRIGIYGASYGAYAALMGAVREPHLYRCVAGLSGAYDLNVQWRRGEASAFSEGRDYLRYAIGKDQRELDERSPAFHAEQIEVPVLLAHGKQDQRAPVENFYRMRDALLAAHKPVETLVKEDEGHGFYIEQNREAFYTRLLDFLDRNLAG